jgi:RNA polymerase sigma factor (sigma-70 family)
MDDLFERAKNGDSGAEKQLFERLRVRFRHFAGRIIRDKDAVEDVVQEACLTVLEKYKTTDFPNGFSAWAHGVLKMKIRKYLERTAANRERSLPESKANDSQVSPSVSSDPDLKRRLMECLKRILKVNRRYARALNLSYLGFQVDEMCRRLKVKPNNLYVILNRGRSMLKECLQALGE